MNLYPETRATLFLGLFVVLGGCSAPDHKTAPPMDTGLTTEGFAGVTDRYDPDHLTVVDAQLEEAEWAALLMETRLFYELLLGPECLEEPIPKVFEWHPGSVFIDDEPLDEVGFRKKGLIGSLSWTRPSLKVDSDRFVDDQEFADGTEHFTFNNNNQDPSRLHTCLAYSVFRAAGSPAPRCAFATVSVNGENLGVYSNVQPIKKAFLRENFGNDEGDLYEGTASDFSPELLVTFEVKSDGSSLEPLEELADALLLPDDELMDRLDEVLDVDAFITHWAVEGLIGHWDGYAQGTNNFYLYHNPEDGLLHFIPWGADAVYEDPYQEPLYARGQLALRLYNHPEAQAAWYDEMQRLLDEVWDEDLLLAETDRMETLIAPHLLDPDLSFAYMDWVRDFIDARRATVQRTLDEEPLHYPWYVAERYCVDPIGSVSATFDLEWATDLEGDPFVADATLSAEAYGASLVDDYVGGLAGPDEYGTPLVVIMGIDAGFTEVSQAILILPPSLEPGAYDIDIAAIPGYMLTIMLEDGETEVAGLMGGEVVFDEVSLVPGGRVSGSLDAILIPNIFE